MTISVIIPTYRRPKDLVRCLEAFRKQTRIPEEILVIVRRSDSETLDLLKEIDTNGLALRTIIVDVPGQVAALNAGLDEVHGIIIAFTDDDAVPRLDWLERIERYFQRDSKIGGVGGCDWIYHNGRLVPGTSRMVASTQWCGRIIGRYHWGVGGPREVDMLKGVNMSFRLVAINGKRFDERLRGTGAQVHNEMSLCLSIKRAGWKLIYDPNIVVEHYPGERFDEDKRGQFNSLAIENTVHNETLIWLEYFSPLRKIASMLWAVLIGNYMSAPGIVMWLLFILPTSDKYKWIRLWATWRGRWAGWKTWRFFKRQNLMS